MKGVADFIRNHHEDILSEWEIFARTLLPAAEGQTKAALRDHAKEILTAIVDDMETLQSAVEQSDKSKGLKVGAAGSPGAIGTLHALLRIERGFTLSQVVAEYRALRASVLRLWKNEEEDAPDAEGVLRFNEAIDEALAEAVVRYTEKTSTYRDQLLGMVSHDLRNPLGSIIMGATLLSHNDQLDDKSIRVVTRIQNSARRMDRLVGDLLDLTRTRLGAEIPLVRGLADVGEICQVVIAELEGSHPTAVLRFTSTGDLRGQWDGGRLTQVMSNLVGNALHHGDVSRPISVVANGEGEHVVVVEVHNEGPSIPARALRDIFEPSVRNVQDDPGKASAGLGLGLGLFIASEIVAAHRGKIEVSSSDDGGTTFTVRLPRQAG